MFSPVRDLDTFGDLRSPESTPAHSPPRHSGGCACCAGLSAPLGRRGLLRGTRENRLIAQANPVKDAALMLCDLAAQQQAGEHRHDRQREDERREQREDHGHRHRPEHFAFNTLKAQYRKVDGRDDEDREGHRPGDFFGGLQHERA